LSPSTASLARSRADGMRPVARLPAFLTAIVADEAKAVRLVRAAPGIAQARSDVERLMKEIPHQLYAGDTALHVAAAALRPLAVAALIDAGADAKAENRRGASALHYACDARPAGKTWNPAAQRSVIELLLDAGSDIEHKDKAGTAPLHPRADTCRGCGLSSRPRYAGAAARMAAVSSRFGPYNPGASPPARRHISASWPR
jgi:ankyrin repeat protein